MDKKGISAVVAVVLTIFITLAGVVVVWNVVVPMIKTELFFEDAGRVSVVSARGYTVCDSDKEIISIQVKQESADVGADEIKLIIGHDGSSYSKIVDAPGSGQTRTYVFNVSGYACDFDYVSVVPIIDGSEGVVGSKVSFSEGSLIDIPLGISSFFEDAVEIILEKLVGLSVVEPADFDGRGVFQNEFFEVVLNVSCLQANCGEVDVSLDPVFSLAYDSFEDQDWVTDGGDSWLPDSTGGTIDIFNEAGMSVGGSWSVRMGNAGNMDQWLDLPIDTTGYEDIEVNFWYAETGGWEPTDCFTFSWWDGSSRHDEFSLCDDFPTQATFAKETILLGVGANDNSDFSIRFYHLNPTTGNIEELWIDDVSVTGFKESASKSGLIPVGSGNPFYTNASSNPLRTGSLAEGESELVTFWVNATGEINDAYDFFAFVNLTSDTDIGNVSEHWDVWIK